MFLSIVAALPLFASTSSLSRPSVPARASLNPQRASRQTLSGRPPKLWPSITIRGSTDDADTSDPQPFGDADTSDYLQHIDQPIAQNGGFSEYDTVDEEDPETMALRRQKELREMFDVPQSGRKPREQLSGLSINPNRLRNAGQ